MNYRHFIREQVFKPNIEGMDVLEIGPLAGLMSKEILSCNPNLHHTIDPEFKPTFKGTVNDFFSGKFKLPTDMPTTYDVVVCMGVLYHLHSPYHMIEQLINHCKPKTLIIETATNAKVLRQEQHNIHGNAYADKVIQYPIQISMCPSREDITKAIETTPMKLHKYWDYWPDGDMGEFEDDEHPDWVKNKSGMFTGVYKWEG